MISKIRITMDIPIEHHSEANECFLRGAVLGSIFNQLVAVSSTDAIKSYKVMRATHSHTEVLPHDYGAADD